MHLPFLVVHGAVVWKLALVVLIGAAFGAGYLLRASGARRRARRERDLLARDVSAPKAGPTVVRGRITKGTATTIAQRGSQQSAPAQLTLDCGGAIVEIDATICVEQGTRARSTGLHPFVEPSVTKSVHVGDEVIAAGDLVAEPGDAASYRETEIRWRLSGDPVRIIATAPRTRPMPLYAAHRFGLLLVVSLTGLGALYIAGRSALHVADKVHYGSLSDGNVPELGATALAAAFPGTRDKALELLDSQLEGYRLPVTERAFSLLLELAELRGNCPAYLYEHSVRLEPALAAARRCGEREQVVELLAFLGRFDEAERELPEGAITELATTIHIATGHWAAAARGVDARADGLAHRNPVEIAGAAEYQREAVAQLRCLAAMLRTFAGEANAFDGVKDRGQGSGCAIVKAAALPVEEQAAAFAAIPAYQTNSMTSAGYDLTAGELAYAAGPAPREYFHGNGTSALMFQFDQDRIWTAPFQLAAHPDDPIAHENMTAVAVLRGDLAAAHQHLAHIQAPGDLALGVALREPGPIAAERGRHPGLDEALALRQGVVPEELQRYMDEDSPFRALIRRAVDGDGEALALALQEAHLQWEGFALPLLGLLPRITRNTDAAASAVRMFRNELTTYGYDHIPFRLLSDVVMYRDAARLVGDTADAKQWQAIVDRYAAMLGDRQKLTAFLFWTD